MPTPPNNLKDLVTLHEGRVPYGYQDSLGFWTIGVGHLIDKRKGGSLPDHIIDALFDWDLKVHKEGLLRHQPWVSYIDPVRQAVMIDMTFNMGVEPFNNDHIKDWPNFLRQVKSGDYKGAAANMRSTTWATQVKGRADRLATMMETGEWPK